MRKKCNLVYLSVLICLFSANIWADAVSFEEQVKYDREQICRDYATGNPSRFEEEENKRQANSNILSGGLPGKLPGTRNENRSFWTNSPNSSGSYNEEDVPTIGVQIVVCAEAREPRLLIPPKLSEYIRKDLQNLEVKEKAGISTTQTIIIGTFLSLAFVFGGVWLMRSPQNKNVKINVIIGGLILGMLVTAATFAFPYFGGELENKQTLLRGLQTRNIVQDYEVQFYVMENNSDLNEVVLIVPLRTPRNQPNTNVGRSNIPNKRTDNQVIINSSNSANKIPTTNNSIKTNRPANSVNK